MSFRSFLDVLFILLLGTLVMLTQAVQLGEVDAEMVRLGGGGVSPIRAGEIQIVAVTEDELRLEQQRFADVEALSARLDPGRSVLLVAVGEDVRHQRVMNVWSALHGRRLDVRLGAAPQPPKAPH